MPATIETYAPPRSLYRFRTIGEVPDFRNKAMRREVDCILEGQLWCGEYHNLNDAMEGLYEAGDAARGQPQWEHARALIRDRKASIGIACFTEVWEQALMWAHYADAFRGICIEYDFELLRRSLPEESSFSRISYADRLLDIGGDLHDPRRLAKWILSTKHHSWAYEREWRLFTPERGEVRFNPAAIIRVIVGPRTPESVAAFLARQIGDHLVRPSRVKGYNVELV